MRHLLCILPRHLVPTSRPAHADTVSRPGSPIPPQGRERRTALDPPSWSSHKHESVLHRGSQRPVTHPSNNHDYAPVALARADSVFDVVPPLRLTMPSTWTIASTSLHSRLCPVTSTILLTRQSCMPTDSQKPGYDFLIILRSNLASGLCSSRMISASARRSLSSCLRCFCLCMHTDRVWSQVFCVALSSSN